jgi:acetyltransferase-like isoleucine patch superfamily enzyme
MRFSGIGFFGRIASSVAALGIPPFYGRIYLAKISPRGYISPKATIFSNALDLGRHVYIDDRVLIYQDYKGGRIKIDEAVHLHRETCIQTGHGGTVTIGAETHIQPRCQLSAYKGAISIGRRVEIAPNCCFYPYNHGMQAEQPIRDQPLTSKGGIIIEDDAWLSVGVVVLDGVRIGKGAVVGAGAVVTHDLPPNSISMGAPARVIRLRSGPVDSHSPSDGDLAENDE